MGDYMGYWSEDFPSFPDLDTSCENDNSTTLHSNNKLCLHESQRNTSDGSAPSPSRQYSADVYYDQVS